MHRPETSEPSRVSFAEAWFGDAFTELHPQLQHLHRQGGVLRGVVHIATGSGLAGVIGRRLARRLGMPLGQAVRGFEVRIWHTSEGMHWVRRFDDGSVLASVFLPEGTYPHGVWRERTGALDLQLGVDILDRGWHWRLRGWSLRGVPLPRHAIRMQAYKSVQADGGYRFAVAFALVGIGTLLRYEGVLALEPAATPMPVEIIP